MFYYLALHPCPLAFSLFAGCSASLSFAQDILMTRAAAAAGAAADKGEWWEAEIEIGETDVSLDFVFQYYEHFDNNQGRDYKALVELPEGVG